MDNLKKALATTVDKGRGNTCGDIVEQFLKPRESTMFGHPVYYMDRPWPLISIYGPHEEFSKMILGYG